MSDTAAVNFSADLKAAADAVEQGLSGMPDGTRAGAAGWITNRTVFLRFIEECGWLGGSGGLSDRYRALGARDPWVYLLGPLLGLGLSKRPGGRSPEFEQQFGPVPFVGEQLAFGADDAPEPEFSVDARAVAVLFDRVLDRYRFAVSEGSPGGNAGTITPDRWGYAYEEMIADQHGRGAYYTGPAEVELMCRESLRLYLEQRCPEADRGAIAWLLSREASRPPDDALLPPERTAALYEALHWITVCDPAIGPGTFPVAMTRALFGALSAFGPRLESLPGLREQVDSGNLADPRDLVRLKSHIIEHSIYGADIDPSAVDIARMRLLLEIASVCEGPGQLPEVDLKLTTGEALVSIADTGPDGEPVLVAGPELPLFRPTQATPLRELTRKFADSRRRLVQATGTVERERLRAKVRECRTRLDAAVRDLQGTGGPATGHLRAIRHVTWQLDFAEIFHGSGPGFDIVIGNPPYVRKEEIDPLYRELGIPLTKKDLQGIYRRLTGESISGHADLYVYFYFRALSLLKPQAGVLCYITSNAWLDVKYGRAIQKLLLERTHIRAIIENRAHRSFRGADVNSVITLCHTEPDPGEHGHLARFVKVSASFEEALGSESMDRVLSAEGPLETPKFQVLPVSHRDLLEGGPSGGKWGGSYLRSPGILHSLLTELEWEPLGHLADVVTYLNTGGCDDFYFVSVSERDDGHVRIASQAYPDESFRIESRFVVPLVRSPSALPRPLIREADLRHHLLRIPAEEALDGLEVRDYVAWGESKGLHRRAGPRVRRPWWKLPVQAYTGYPILVSRHHHDHLNVFLNPDGAIANSFYGIVLRDEAFPCEGLLAYLSSSLGVMLCEIYGRTNQGQGVLNTYGDDLSFIPIFSALQSAGTDWPSAVAAFVGRPFSDMLTDCGLAEDESGSSTLSPTPERRSLDAAVFDALGLSSATRDEITNAACRLIHERLHRARRTVRKPRQPT